MLPPPGRRGPSADARAPTPATVTRCAVNLRREHQKKSGRSQSPSAHARASKPHTGGQPQFSRKTRTRAGRCGGGASDQDVPVTAAQVPRTQQGRRGSAATQTRARARRRAAARPQPRPPRPAAGRATRAASSRRCRSPHGRVLAALSGAAPAVHSSRPATATHVRPLLRPSSPPSLQPLPSTS